KPMVLRGRFVAHDVDRAVVGGNDGVETAVVIDVANGHAAAQPRLAENDARCSGNVDELFTGVAQKKHGFAVMEIGIADLDGVKIVALGDQEILPTVIVVVEEAYAPSGVGHGDASDAGREAVVGESRVAVVLVEGVALVGKVRNDQIRPAVIIIVGEIDAHTGEGAAVAVDGDFGEEAHFFKGSVAFVVIEEFDHRVVGNEEINMAVAVVIGESDTQAFAAFCETDFLRDFRERSEEHTSELQSRFDLVCRLLLEKKKKKNKQST